MPDDLTRTVTTDDRGVALEGMDPVTYFAAGGPQRGSAEIAENHEGATWWFVDESNQKAFVEDPGKYMPQFGGHCVFGAARGQAFPGDPNAWTVANGRLYLSINRFVRTVMGPTSKRIAKAETAWQNAS